MTQFLAVQAAMRTPLPKAPKLVPLRYVGKPQRHLGRLAQATWDTECQRATDIMAYINGPRRVYTFGTGTYFVRHEGRRRLVDIHQVLRVMREAAAKEIGNVEHS